MVNQEGYISDTVDMQDPSNDSYDDEHDSESNSYGTKDPHTTATDEEPEENESDDDEQLEDSEFDKDEMDKDSPGSGNEDSDDCSTFEF